MEPLYQNLFGMFLMLVYIQTVVSVCDWAVSKNYVSLLLSRKTVHIAAACSCLFWTVFDEAHWTWRLNITVPAIYALKLIVKGFILKDPNDYDVKTLSRTGRPIELCQGPLMFAIVLVYTGLYQFKTDVGVYMMAAMGFGDGIAPVVGTFVPFGYYKIGGGIKTLSGSAGVFVGTVIGIVFLRAAIGAPSTPYTDRVLGVAITATLAEAVSGKWDNLVIAASVWLFLKATTATITL
jgi:phytol kinase